MGYLPLPMTDGTIHWQQCFYSANAVETIISPQAILAASDVFASWTMTGYKDSRPGAIRFDSYDGFLCMAFGLECRDGLYYCPTDIFTLDKCPSSSRLFVTEDTPCRANRTVTTQTPPVLRCSSRFEPTSKARQLESEIWLLWLGSPGVRQLDVLPQNATGLPAVFEYHPFCFIDFKEQARIRKQATQRTAVRTTERRRRFYMDFGFMRASTTDYSRRDKSKDRVVLSYDGFSAYFLIVDEASRYVWIFLTNSKSPPLDIIEEFLTLHGHAEGGCIRTNQGGKLAGSSKF
jgi:hypothetical protein